ncbi:MAG: xylose isomerase, partial [Clostridiales Family XIII bacterium]|nr:xylose isomerase [Clostridiales Family XIII bacterium]
MAEIFEGLPKIEYRGAQSREALAFKYFDAGKVVLGRPMREHLKFAMAWWHNLGATGTDMFGPGTADKRFGAAAVGTMEHAHAKVEAGFEFMDKLGIDYFCFHDVDLVPEAEDIKETNRRLDEVVDHIAELQAGSG